MEEEKRFKGKLIVSKEMFYNEENSWGAYAFRIPKGTFIGEVNLHPTFYTLAIAGDVQRLEEGKEYLVEFREGYDEKRKQLAYYFIEVPSEGIKGRQANETFLKAMVTVKQAQDILKKFKNDEIVSDIVNRRVDLTLVKGIGEDTSNKIIKKLEDFQLYSEAIIKLSPLGASINAIIRLADAFESPQKLLAAVEKDIYSLTTVGGFGFKKIDEYAKEMGIKENDPRRIIAGSFYVIDILVQNGDTKIDIQLFDEKLNDILEIEGISDELFSQITSHDLIYCEDGYISLKKYIEEEKYIAWHLRRIRDNFVPRVNKEFVIKEIEKREQLNGFTFNNEQREAIIKGVTSGVMIIDGKGGTGKTFSVKTIIDSIKLPHLAIALSGKAANVLKKNGLESMTIHRGLMNVEEKTDENTGRKYKEFKEDIIILDEASMVDHGLFLKILKHIRNGSQIIIVGDSGQLPPIGRGAFFDYLLKSSEFSHTTLTQVHRQAQDSGALYIANLVRDGKQFNKYSDDISNNYQIYGNNKDMFVFPYQNKEYILGDFIDMVKRYVNNPETNNDDLQVITGLKERGDYSVKNLNILLQPIFNPETMSDDEITNGHYTYRLGDRVIQQGNNYQAAKIFNKEVFDEYANEGTPIPEQSIAQVFNGTFGKIIGCVKGVGILIDFEDVEGLIFYNTDDIGQLDLGYAISCHRSQGSGFNTVFIITTFNEYTLLSRQFLYTAITRTINTCFLFGETKAIHHAIRTDKGRTRLCFLGDILK